ILPEIRNFIINFKKTKLAANMFVTKTTKSGNPTKKKKRNDKNTTTPTTKKKKKETKTKAKKKKKKKINITNKIIFIQQYFYKN
ncbi:hypothetical protein MMJ63_23425, partial [Bacillus vallismortis]|nr:hypothetical protein [Bacillus vallismortis]